MVLDDGTEIPADLVVLSTGYGTPREATRPILGELLDELPDIGGFEADFSQIGVYRYSGKPRLWFAFAPGIYLGRFASKFLALQIKAIEEGIIPAHRS